MAKFHINEKGDAGRCRARADRCPFGGVEDHYSSLEEARGAYERSMAIAEPLTIEKAFENIPLAEEARLYRILTEAGVEYLPWRGREQELTDAYEPWKTITYEEAFERNGKLTPDDAALREALRKYDNTVKGTIIEGYAPDKTQQAAAREALARFRASAVRRDFPGTPNSFRLL